MFVDVKTTAMHGLIMLRNHLKALFYLYCVLLINLLIHNLDNVSCKKLNQTFFLVKHRLQK